MIRKGSSRHNKFRKSMINMDMATCNLGPMSFKKHNRTEYGDLPRSQKYLMSGLKKNQTMGAAIYFPLLDSGN